MALVAILAVRSELIDEAEWLRHNFELFKFNPTKMTL